MMISAADGFILQSQKYSSDNAGKSLSKYIELHRNELAYNHGASKIRHFGSCFRLDKPAARVPFVYHCFRTPDQDPVFVGHSLNRVAVQRQLLQRVTSGARLDGLLNISFDEYGTIVVSLPATLPEQKAIGSLFTDLDASIDQHRRRHEQLKQTKASLLERMFPAPGETVPQVRFDGFDGEWREYPLRQLGVAKTGFGFPHSAQGGRSGIPFFKVSDMNLPENWDTMRVANNYVTSGQVVHHGWHPILDVPAILFAKVGAAVFAGRKRGVRVPFLMDNNMMAFCIDEQRWDASFARVVFDCLDLSLLAQVGALPSFNPPQLHDMVVTVPPTLAEQQALGQFFAKLDALIEAQQHRVEKLQQVKASLLQKMFV